MVMEPLFAVAKGILGRTQPDLNGGLFVILLEDIVPTLSHNGMNSSTARKQIVTQHMSSTFSRIGYASAICLSAMWIISLILATLFVCLRRRHKKKKSTEIVLLTGANHSLTEVQTPRASNGGLLRLQCERLQSYWPCLAAQFFFFIVLTILLSTAVLLGFALSSQLQTNLASSPTHEEAVGRLLNAAELEHTNPPRTHVFPRVLRALAQLRAYFSDFVYYTQNHTAPIVDELINATEQMQAQMTAEFNSLLFEKIGAAEAFELGDYLGSNVISLIEHSMAIVNQDVIFKNHFDRLKVELQTWLRLINSYGPSSNDPECVNRCSSLRATFANNLTTRPDTFMPVFTFAIALKFVTTDQNQTAAKVRDQLNRGKVTAAKQLEETKKIMSKRIDIPKSIRDMTARQWNTLGVQLTRAVQAVDHVAAKVARSVAPKVSSGSNIALAFGCLFWVVLLAFTLGVIWLIIYFHCVPSELSSRSYCRLRTATGFGLVIITLSLLLATTFFLLGGYLYTEACRYIDPEQKPVTRIEHEEFSEKHTDLLFPLDSHVNEFVTRNWPLITEWIIKNAHSGSKPIPIPHVRSPVYALYHNCKKNMGILEATDAIKDFDMTSLNDPEMSQRFVEIGREIMLDSLNSIDIDEMFPSETDEQLALAGRLDDFIVNFDEIRATLPTAYLSVYDTDEGTGDHRLFSVDELWASWESYYSEVLQRRITDEQNVRLTLATQQVTLRLSNLVTVVETMSDHLKKLSTAKRIGPVVLQLKTVLSELKALLANKPVLTELASQLFDKHIAVRTPDEAAKLIVKFGPRIMTEVGHCRRLYEAAKDLNGAVCGGVVDVLNGLWLVWGWTAFVGTLIITFGSILLLHKSPVTNGIKPFFLAPPSFHNVCTRRRRNGAIVSHSNHAVNQAERVRLHSPYPAMVSSQSCGGDIVQSL